MVELPSATGLNNYNSTGIAVVNPLIRVEKKLIKIKELISEIDSETELTANDLKNMIAKMQPSSMIEENL